MGLFGDQDFESFASVVDLISHGDWVFRSSLLVVSIRRLRRSNYCTKKTALKINPERLDFCGITRPLEPRPDRVRWSDDPQ